MAALSPDGILLTGRVAVVTGAGRCLARFVTGTTVHVDGGIHAAGGWRRIGQPEDRSRASVNPRAPGVSL